MLIRGYSPPAPSATATDWVITGRKYFSSNASVASFFIVVAITDPDVPVHRGASTFLIPAGTEGLNLEANHHLVGADPHEPGHSLVHYDGVRVPSDALLGEAGQGFLILQTRLAGGRLHHAMRAIGMAQRAVEMMSRRAKSRYTQGSSLADKQLVQEFVADSYTELIPFRLTVLHAAWLIDSGDERAARAEIGACKILASQVLKSIALRAIQVHGALGFTDQLPLVNVLLGGIALGLADGPTEAHKVNLARMLLKGYEAEDGEWPSEMLDVRRDAAREKYGAPRRSRSGAPRFAMNNRVTAAVERALDDRQRGATEEVERILAAAVRVMERVAPEAPRVSDIVAEAGSSNKAFYRYFAGKDEVILAVMERGVGIVVSYLQHQMAKESQPAEKIARWIEGTLAQVAEPELISKSRAAAGQMSARANWRAADQEMMRPLRDLLVDPVAALGSSRRGTRRRCGVLLHAGDDASIHGFGGSARARRHRPRGAVLSQRTRGQLMRAVVCRSYGTPDELVIEDVPEPVPGPGQLLVRVHAAAVNFPDVLFIAGKYQVKIPAAVHPGQRDRRRGNGRRRRCVVSARASASSRAHHRGVRRTGAARRASGGGAHTRRRGLRVGRGIRRDLPHLISRIAIDSRKLPKGTGWSYWAPQAGWGWPPSIWR